MLNKMSYDHSGLCSATDGEAEVVEEGSNVRDSTILIDLYRVRNHSSDHGISRFLWKLELGC